jgi:uncharacterized protein (DUF1330 family)
MKPGYWIARSKILDESRYFEYVRLAGEASKKFQPEMLTRGGRFEILEGTAMFHRHVIVRYPSFDAAMAFYHSPEYQAAAAIRRAGAGINELAIVEGEELGG